MAQAAGCQRLQPRTQARYSSPDAEGTWWGRAGRESGPRVQGPPPPVTDRASGCLVQLKTWREGSRPLQQGGPTSSGPIAVARAPPLPACAQQEHGFVSLLQAGKCARTTKTTTRSSWMCAAPFAASRQVRWRLPQAVEVGQSRVLAGKWTEPPGLTGCPARGRRWAEHPWGTFWELHAKRKGRNISELQVSERGFPLSKFPLRL